MKTKIDWFFGVMLFLLLGIILGCEQVTNVSNDSDDEKVYVPNLPVSVGNNPFAGKTFILFDRNNEVDEKIVFSENGYKVWEWDNSQWVLVLQGAYSYNVSLSQIYSCITLVVIDGTSDWVNIGEYFTNLMTSDTHRKMGALKCGLDINATISEIKTALINWCSEPSTQTYTIGSMITINNTTGYKLELSGVYDVTSPWYNQRNGSFIGESNSETECNIEYANIGWFGSIDYQDSSLDYCVTDVTDSIVHCMDVYETTKSHQYTKTGSGALTEIVLIGNPGSVILTWESSDDMN